MLFLFQLAGDAVPLWSVRSVRDLAESLRRILEQITLLSLCLSTPRSINRLRGGGKGGALGLTRQTTFQTMQLNTPI